MKIQILSERFLPSIGGIEAVTRVLAEAFVRAGHETTVITREHHSGDSTGGLNVLRCPGPVTLLKTYAQADAIILQGSVAHLGWPLFFLRRPALMVHHMFPDAHGRGCARLFRAKLAARLAHAAVSHAIAQKVPWPINAVLPNPYDAHVFRTDWNIRRSKDLVFLGRLIPGKGAHVLIEALGVLRNGARGLSATIIGAGPEKEALAELARSRGLCHTVRFVGEVTGTALAQLLNQHRVMVVPSLVAEGFGIVALEGIACGCVIVGSQAGGLPEAIGPCGATFSTGDAAALAALLTTILPSNDALAGFRVHAARHLAQHRPDAVAQRYLSTLGNMKSRRHWHSSAYLAADSLLPQRSRSV
ncbi:MAG TPA: glycosyltransferase family 4 protein [Verrucomicrobiae bacterium]|nr:glycosyltransferase family 4 protein [Verrucomicrobiae bacterium]